MERAQIEQKLLEVLHGEGHEELTIPLNRDAKLQEDLGMDSLDTVEFIMATEEAFGDAFAITDEESEKIFTIGQVLDFIESKC
jgi:acyl carrier protein